MLAGSERERHASLLLSLAVTPTCWGLAEGLAWTYARCATELDEPEARARLAPAEPSRIDFPPLAVLEIAPAGGSGLAALEAALGGPGRPSGVSSCRRAGGTLVVEFDAAVSSLDLVVTLIDVELRGTARRIVPLLPLEDEVLARFASARLGAPSFGASRIIETYAEALLRE
jgi:hypothetical protein